MPDITDPKFVKFANERLRPTADMAEQAYQTFKRLQQEWVANAASGIPNQGEDLFADGSASDGRKPMSGAIAHGLKGLCDLMVTWYETNATIDGVTKTRIAHVQSVSVNGQARF